MLQIDGARGEGGGQILRSALTLSLLTGTPVHLINIRARRPKPGLMPQHLQAVQAAAAVGEAEVEGAFLGSQALRFVPRGRRGGTFRFDIGTAGATSLVLQTVFLPLSAAAEPSHLTLTGGTHVPWSPCHHYLELHWLPLMRRLGCDAELRLELAGFYPQGGGRVRAHIRPVARLVPLQLTVRGRLLGIRGLSAVANLDLSIAERQRLQALQRLAPYCREVDIEVVRLPARGKGTLLLLLAQFEHARCCYYALGERGKPAERVADEAVEQLLAFLHSEAAVDEFLADQLLLPLAFAPGTSELTTARVTQHLLTNAEVIRQFLPVEIDIRGALGAPGWLRLTSTTPFPAAALLATGEARGAP
ncbi:MAG: ribosomal subunit interface protein [Candidatus Tectimicrobiota bacterium]|nr:MAG: ribosomal subunit interface protein [Candidatus Tectomicrobia bacterium]